LLILYKLCFYGGGYLLKYLNTVKLDWVMVGENKFPLEKILSISARDYCDMHGKNIGDFEAIGVHVNAYPGCRLREKFQIKVPPETEVVVEYHGNGLGGDGYGGGLVGLANGTALIPRKRK
jgi:hypothetical protein